MIAVSLEMSDEPKNMRDQRDQRENSHVMFFCHIQCHTQNYGSYSHSLG